MLTEEEISEIRKKLAELEYEIVSKKDREAEEKSYELDRKTIKDLLGQRDRLAKGFCPFKSAWGCGVGDRVAELEAGLKYIIDEIHGHGPDGKHFNWHNAWYDGPALAAYEYRDMTFHVEKRLTELGLPIPAGDLKRCPLDNPIPDCASDMKAAIICRTEGKICPDRHTVLDISPAAAPWGGTGTQREAVTPAEEFSGVLKHSPSAVTAGGHEAMWWYGMHIPTLVRIKEIIDSDVELHNNIASGDGWAIIDGILDRYIKMPFGDGKDQAYGVTPIAGSPRAPPTSPEGKRRLVAMHDHPLCPACERLFDRIEALDKIAKEMFRALQDIFIFRAKAYSEFKSKEWKKILFEVEPSEDGEGRQ